MIVTPRVALRSRSHEQCEGPVANCQRQVTGDNCLTLNYRFWPVCDGGAIPAVLFDAPGLSPTDLYRISTTQNSIGCN
jgi:hypothetical protein